jgi:hypothetical protein
MADRYIPADLPRLVSERAAQPEHALAVVSSLRQSEWFNHHCSWVVFDGEIWTFYCFLLA